MAAVHATTSALLVPTTKSGHEKEVPSVPGALRACGWWAKDTEAIGPA
eukprot:CAMPEP_0119092766 /NCGR_PEP_ID=MMETSP1178-20130426/160863_1 /TAXON_ID=33656 /ORGANISM="unid sp, Strain CCMP2000" /LENGTH=47 /DNA_ID= /DNA_START= /DNA_END= /DNA_ORIENTATION=